MSKKQKTDSVWVLTITHGIDDYKHRGNCAHSDVEVCSTEEKCYNRLYNIVLDALIEKLNDGSKALLKEAEQLKELGILTYEAEVWDKPKEVAEKYPCFDAIMDNVTEAEFIPYLWDCTIRSYEVQ